MSPTRTTSLTAELSDSVTDRLEIVELSSAMGLLIDAREWDALEQRVFGDPVDVDYTSLQGGDPQTVRPEELIGGWRQVLDHLDATQHLISGQVVTVDGDRATCAANVQGTHVLANATGGPLWTVGGRYDFGLSRTGEGWRINALTLTVLWATGNRHIMQLAEAGGRA
jgi:SnoaL-like domain